MTFICTPFIIHDVAFEYKYYEAHSPRIDEDVPKSFLVEGPSGISMVLDYQTSIGEADPERLVQAIESEGCKSLEALVYHPLRLMIDTMDERAFESVALQQVRIKPEDPVPRLYHPVLPWRS